MLAFVLWINPYVQSIFFSELSIKLGFLLVVDSVPIATHHFR